MLAYSHKIAQLKEWYERHEKRFSTFSLLFGFVFDSLTLQRIDAVRENVWIALNLVLVAVCIVLLNKRGTSADDGASWRHFWLFNILQFGFGALLGAFFIFYFRSATLVGAWPFLLILLAAMVANELFQKRYARLALQLSFFYLSVFSFAIFLLPLLAHRIGPVVFLASGVLSLVVLWLFILVLKYFVGEKFRDGRTLVMRSIVTIFLGVNLLYFTNLIPPIPLSLQDAGIYHSIERLVGGSYLVSGEKRGFFEYFHLRERVNLIPGDSLYAYSAIFSPAAFNTPIVHEWQYKKDSTGKWVTASRIPLSLSGGRAGGFRTYSIKTNLAPGLWRVNVATPRGQLIGRISFRVIASGTRPFLEASVKE